MCIAIWLGTAQAVPAETVCAVVPQPGSELARNAADLLETKLATDGVRLVSRAELRSVLTEQLLGSAFAAEGTQSRLQLGKLVKADLLVFLRERRGKEAQAIELTVAETRRGLRLVMETDLWEVGQAEAICKQFATAAQRARDLAARPDLRVFAVPPFESRDLMPDFEQRRRGYAHLAEQYLVRHPGIVVVELAEAEALAQEAAIAGQVVARDLPYYILGSYRTARLENRWQTSFTIELQHAKQSLGKNSRDDLPPDRLGQTIEAAISEVLATGVKQPAGEATVKLEPALLVERGDVFARVGEWDLAMPLYQSALLLDPRQARAHFRLFEAHRELSREGTPSMLARNRMVDYAGRMRHADLALDYLEPLLLQRLYRARANQATVAADPSERFSQVLLDEIIRDLARWYVNLPSKYDMARDPRGIMPAYRRVWGRLAQMLSDTLADPRAQQELDTGSIRSLARNAVEATGKLAGAGEVDAGSRTVRALVESMDNDRMAGVLVGVVLRWIDDRRDAEERERLQFFEWLERSSSPRMKLAAEVARIVNSACDAASCEQARSDLAKLASSNSRVAAVAPQVRAVIDSRARTMLAAKPRSDSPGQSGKIMVPKLNLLNERLKLSLDEGSSPVNPGRVDGWIVCDENLEVLATNRGIFRLGENGNWASILPMALSGELGQQLRLMWDGRYVWAKFWPWGPILVVDPARGKEVVRFDESDLPEGLGTPWGELAVVGPGQACFFGYTRSEATTARNYAALLAVQANSDGSLGKRAEVFFETRRVYGMSDATDESDRDQIDAMRSEWAVTVPRRSAGAGPCVVVGQRGRPLIVDVTRKTVSQAKHRWPWGASLLFHEGWCYVGGGETAHHTRASKPLAEVSWLYRTDHPGNQLDLIVDFGERPTRHNTNGFDLYYSSMVVFENKLHLLTYEDFIRKTPSWSAVDLTTWETSVLVDLLPQEFSRAQPHEFCVSKRHGLILLSGGRAFQVELPPAENWPRMDAKVLVNKESAARPAGQPATAPHRGGD